MYIKSITIDGFKSYGKRVEVGPFDKAFTAITGLNGSGKSNILDSICFVLGSSNMSLARVANLRELIFKAGNAGVVKATVSITFDNTDKDGCPPSYEAYDEIVVTREVNMQSRSKYCINGFSATTQQVTDLFHSVQLNINNPHFLIMQGRITKVLNMKPPEILAMVEEATGASRYELKRRHSENLIEKKQAALNSIDILLTETIVPNLEKVKKEQAGLREFQELVRELEHKEKVNVAYHFVLNQDLCDNANTNVAKKREERNTAEEAVAEIEEKASELTEEVKRLEKEKDDEFGGKLAKMEEALKKVEMEETKLTANLTQQKEVLKEAEKKRKQVDKQLTEENKLKVQKEKEHSKIREVFDEMEDNLNRDEQNLEQAQKDFEAISAGASRAADGEATATLADQLMTVKNEIATTETEISKAKMKLPVLKRELNKKQTDLQKNKGSFDAASSNVNKVQKEFDAAKKKLDKINFNEEAYLDMLNKKKTITSECNKLNNTINNMETRNQLNVSYSDPDPNFDRSAVHGLAAKLFRVKDPVHMTALEQVSPGNLYSVVVENEHIAKQLLNHGRLTKRTTFLPLTKIKGRELNRNVLRTAEGLVGRDNVKAAIDLVEFDNQYLDVMQYIFGDTLICTDMETAKKVCYHPQIKKKTLTLAGEVFDPSGTLKGGSRENESSVLKTVAELQLYIEQLDQGREELQQLEEELKSLDANGRAYHEAKREYDLKSHELDLIKENLEKGEQFSAQREVEALATEVEGLENVLKELPQKKREAEQKAKEISDKMKNSKSIRERELKEAEVALKKAQQAYDKSKKATSSRTNEVESLKLEIEALAASVTTYNQQISEADEEIARLSEEVSQAKEAVNEASSKVKSMKDEFAHHKAILKSKSGEIDKLIRQRDSCAKKIEAKQLEIKKIDHEIENIEKNSADAASKVKQLLKKYPWIKEEKQLFGNESEGYPLKRSDFDIHKLQDEITEFTERKTKLGKTVNMRANAMLNDREGEAERVTERRKIVASDKRKLIDYMKEVDQMKKDELVKAFDKINQHFGSIFKSLLPGTDAKLIAPRGKTIHDGLEVKVAFGDIWKESLTELSGGQRSLVALSLILALLRYNPAPIYILDEVDAALDQSHTTNIGKMIKDNFPDSQFIIVSLKDDMFNNANVLFKTRFVDGNSTVSRQAARK